MDLPIILASASPNRLNLLKQIGIVPTKVIPADIDETEKPREKPVHLAGRLAVEKAKAIASIVDLGIIIAADTVPVVGGKIMRKASNEDEVRECLRLLSNKRHQVYTGVCVIRKAHNELKLAKKTVKSIVKFKNITPLEIEYYCQLGEGIGKAGGYTIGGYAESFVIFISGSFSNIIGLPLYETMNMVRSMGYYS